MKFIDTVKELFAAYAALVLIAAALYAHFEQASFLNALWWACVTALTVGYGDLYPATAGGKVVAVVLMHASVLLIMPLLIGNICSHCIRNEHQFTHHEQEEIKEALQRLETRLDAMGDRRSTAA